MGGVGEIISEEMGEGVVIANVYEYSGSTTHNYVIGKYKTNHLVLQSTKTADLVLGHMEDAVMTDMVAMNMQQIMEENSFREGDAGEGSETNGIGLEVPGNNGASVVEKAPTACFSTA